MPDSQRTAPTGPETPASLLQSQLSKIHSLLTRCLSIIVAAWRRTSAALRFTSRGLRRRSTYLLKTFGVLVAIAFGTASVVYAKQAADDARCQLRLAERQYCEAASEASAQSSECQDILRASLSLVFCSPMVFPTRGFSTKFRDMVPYLVPSTLRDPPSYMLDVVSMLNPNPWYYSLGIPYQQWCGPKPRFWRFPDLYATAEFFRGRVGMSLVSVGIAFMGWMSLQRHGFLSRGVLYSLVVLQLGVVYLSWRLLEDDLAFQRKYWDGRVKERETCRNFFPFRAWDNVRSLNETKPNPKQSSVG